MTNIAVIIKQCLCTLCSTMESASNFFCWVHNRPFSYSVSGNLDLGRPFIYHCKFLAFYEENIFAPKKSARAKKVLASGSGSRSGPKTRQSLQRSKPALCQDYILQSILSRADGPQCSLKPALAFLIDLCIH